MMWFDSLLTYSIKIAQALKEKIQIALEKLYPFWAQETFQGIYESSLNVISMCGNYFSRSDIHTQVETNNNNIKLKLGIFRLRVM